MILVREYVSGADKTNSEVDSIEDAFKLLRKSVNSVKSEVNHHETYQPTNNRGFSLDERLWFLDFRPQL